MTKWIKIEPLRHPDGYPNYSSECQLYRTSSAERWIGALWADNDADIR
jgi:hypothetical protein